MDRLATACEAIAATTKKLVKTAIVADYLKSRSTDEAAVSAIFLSGRAFPAWEETTLQVGGRSLWQIVAELSGKDEGEINAAYRRHGDLGAVAGEILAGHAGQGLGVLEVEATFREIAAARGPAAKTALVRNLISRATQLEAKYIIKIMTGDLRIGLKESLVEEAIAKAYGETPVEVQRANMLLGDLGETVRLAAEGKLGEAHMRMFHAIGFMLASPIESSEEGWSYFAEAAVEDKYDGIRAQAHVADGEVKFFSRTRDEITESFPELPDALSALPQNAILDGEIIAWDYDAGRARPFSVLQQRLGQEESQRQDAAGGSGRVPGVRRFVCGGELVIDRPLRERAQILDRLLAQKPHCGEGDTAARRRTGKAGTQGKLSFGDEEEIGCSSRNSRAGVSRLVHSRSWRSCSRRRRRGETKG